MAIILWVADTGAGSRAKAWLEGHEVQRARDVRAALAVLEGVIVDVVAVPVDLPVADQLALVAHLRADSVFGRTRLVAVPAAPRQRPPRVKRFSTSVRSRLSARQVASGK